MNSNESNIITYNTPDEKASVALYTRDGKVWLDDTIQLCHLADAKSDVQSKKKYSIIPEQLLKCGNIACYCDGVWMECLQPHSIA